MHHTLKQHSNSPKHTTEREAVIDRRALEAPTHRNQPANLADPANISKCLAPDISNVYDSKYESPNG